MKKNRILLIVLLVFSAVVLYIWKLRQSERRFVVYGYEVIYDKSYFLIYGLAEGAELKRIEDRYYVRLKQVEDFGIARVKNDISTFEYIHYFLDVNREVSIYSKDSFPKNKIYFFQDDSLNGNKANGVISFYIGDTINSTTYDRHKSVRDSIIWSLQ